MSKKSTKDILQAPRGMRDFYGEEFLKRKKFFTLAEKISQSYGFSGIETPIMEHTEIFLKGVGKGTDIVDKEMYNLETLGGDRLTLRPEGTAALMRAYIEHGMNSMSGPQMFYYFGPFFRHDKPQKGRYRQLYQFGLEIMGSKNPLYDALIIQTGYEILKKTNKKILIEINSLGNTAERKKYIEALKTFYIQYSDKIGKTDQKRIETNPLRILDSKDTDTKSINKKAPLLLDHLGDESRKYFDTVLKYLDEANIPYKIIPSLVRGLDYYEHTVFEYVTFDEKGKQSQALGGGGRYDGLAETLGHNRSIPSVGLGLGADRIIEASGNFFKKEQKSIPLLLADESAYVKATQIIQDLQGKNINIFLYPLIQKLTKQISRVEKESYTQILILGENEIKKNIILFKDLKTRKQEKINLTNLKDELENYN